MWWQFMPILVFWLSVVEIYAHFGVFWLSACAAHVLSLCLPSTKPMLFLLTG
jgi:hypothetical protein